MKTEAQRQEMNGAQSHTLPATKEMEETPNRGSDTSCKYFYREGICLSRSTQCKKIESAKVSWVMNLWPMLCRRENPCTGLDGSCEGKRCIRVSYRAVGSDYLCSKELRSWRSWFCHYDPGFETKPPDQEEGGE